MRSPVEAMHQFQTAIADCAQHQPARAGFVDFLSGHARGLDLKLVYDREPVRCRRNAAIVSSTLDALCADGSRA
jgi:hypothetical protein